MIKTTCCSGKGPGFCSHYQLTTIYNSIYKGSENVFLPPWLSGMYVVPIHTHRHSIHTHKINEYILKVLF